MGTLGPERGPGGEVVVCTVALSKVRSMVQSLFSDIAELILTRGTTFENRSNLAESFLSQVVSRYEGTRLGRQLSAEILDDIPGALWTRAVIDGRERLANCRKCRELSLRSTR
jgi:phage terminase large subunit-like protein